MRYVPPEQDTEVLSDPTDRTAAAKAKRRMDLCVAPPAEVELYEYEPTGARRNKMPGIPDADY